LFAGGQSGVLFLSWIRGEAEEDSCCIACHVHHCVPIESLKHFQLAGDAVDLHPNLTGKL